MTGALPARLLRRRRADRRARPRRRARCGGPDRPPAASAAAPGCCTKQGRRARRRRSRMLAIRRLSATRTSRATPLSRALARVTATAAGSTSHANDRHPPELCRGDGQISPSRNQGRSDGRPDDARAPRQRPQAAFRRARGGRSRMPSRPRSAGRSGRAGMASDRPARGCGNGRCGTPRTAPGSQPASRARAKRSITTVGGSMPAAAAASASSQLERRQVEGVLAEALDTASVRPFQDLADDIGERCQRRFKTCGCASRQRQGEPPHRYRRSTSSMAGQAGGPAITPPRRSCG